MHRPHLKEMKTNKKKTAFYRTQNRANQSALIQSSNNNFHTSTVTNPKYSSPRTKSQYSHYSRNVHQHQEDASSTPQRNKKKKKKNRFPSHLKSRKQIRALVQSSIPSPVTNPKDFSPHTKKPSWRVARARNPRPTLASHGVGGESAVIW